MIRNLDTGIEVDMRDVNKQGFDKALSSVLETKTEFVQQTVKNKRLLHEELIHAVQTNQVEKCSEILNYKHHGKIPEVNIRLLHD